MLACSPTLEMGIDVGGLDAVVMRNIPPRPDNYAQRGGRAGRRSRVGLVLGYARSTPHDQYFYDKPREMIAGEVPAPAVSLGNRDVIVRHLYAIVFGAAEPGLAGQDGRVRQAQRRDQPGGRRCADRRRQGPDRATRWRSPGRRGATDVLAKAGLDEAQAAGAAWRSCRSGFSMSSTARPGRSWSCGSRWSRSPRGSRRATRPCGPATLINRLLGIPADSQQGGRDADDRSAGYPLRRFAEFGILPGYEFPSQPAALRLLGDRHEEDPISVVRRFGIGQFQPDAHVYARSKRWKVIGLDMASPWNPRSEGPTWSYRVCQRLRPALQRRRAEMPPLRHGQPGPAAAVLRVGGLRGPAGRDADPRRGGTLRRAEPGADLSPVGRRRGRPLDGRQRLGVAAEPQRRGPLGERRQAADAQGPGRGPGPAPAGQGLPALPVVRADADAAAEPEKADRRPPQRQDGQQKQDDIGHAEGCPQTRQQPRAAGDQHGRADRGAAAAGAGARRRASRTSGPPGACRSATRSWPGCSISSCWVRASWTSSWRARGRPAMPTGRYSMLSLAFIDPSLGGSGYLVRIAEQFHRTAEQAIEHLDHPDCETACYRCLKSYYNQRYHQDLTWPQIMPALEELAAAAPQHRPRETGDIDDPRPWLEAYAAGVGSPLELTFLRLFEKHGFHPQKQVPVAPNPGEPPISIADFAVPERRLAIYIDGAAFHVGQRLRRDRFIRDRLRKGSPPWRVEELRAADLGHGIGLVGGLMR